MTDHASRYPLLCQALDSIREDPAIAAFEHLFRERGLPAAIHSDNGVPFASPNALFGLSRLAVWWLRLGVSIERIKPGGPQQNGRHERMHLTLNKGTTRQPVMNSLQQQARFDAFTREFNVERRPRHSTCHAGRPISHTPSPKPYGGLPDLGYPPHLIAAYLVTACGRVCMHRKKINTSTVLARQNVGLKEVDEDICSPAWLSVKSDTATGTSAKRLGGKNGGKNSGLLYNTCQTNQLVEISGGESGRHKRLISRLYCDIFRASGILTPGLTPDPAGRACLGILLRCHAEPA